MTRREAAFFCTPCKSACVGEFYQMVLRNLATIDFDRLRRLSDAVYPGGGDELIRFVEGVKAGRMLRLDVRR